MHTDTLQQKQQRQTTSILKTTPAGNIVVEEIHTPHAGSGACTQCGCKGYVASKDNLDISITAHQPRPNCTCGHSYDKHK